MLYLIHYICKVASQAFALEFERFSVFPISSNPIFSSGFYNTAVENRSSREAYYIKCSLTFFIDLLQ